jgi:protein involved in polysaccharide export with SLBB domain
VVVKLRKAVIDHDPQQNLILQQGDVITIFSKDDIQVPVAQRTKYVMLEGELAHPGIYQVLPGETLRQLVERVGGVTPQAYLFGSEFDRESTQKMQQKRLDEITDKLEAEIQRNATNAAAKAMTPDELTSATTQAQSQQALLVKMRQVKATGRIVLQLPENNPQVKDLPDVALDDGDRFYVPATLSTVSVMGTVYNPNAFLYEPHHSVGDYLAESGGPTQDADPSYVYVVRANGIVFSKQQTSAYFNSFNGRKALPGDTIVVPENLNKSQLTKSIVDYSQIFFNFALSVASLKVLGVI